jgi:aminobenzoyl-glutamate utilization protein B
VSWVVPAGLLNFPSSVPGIQYHEWHAAVTPVSTISHKGQVVGAKVLAASIIDLLTAPDLVSKARAEFEVESKKTPYFSLLPPDAQPPVDLNRAEMEKFRPAMRKFYLDKAPRFE